MSDKKKSMFDLVKGRPVGHNEFKPRVSTDKLPSIGYTRIDSLTEERVDGWTNTLTGLGSAHDKNTYARFKLGVQSHLSHQMLSAMYEHDDMAAKLVDLFPHHMMREGYELTLDTELREPLSDEIERLGVNGHCEDGMVWARLYGGAITIIGAIDGGSPEEPLNENNIDEIVYLNTVDRYHVRIDSYDKDPLSPNFGMPEYYTFNMKSETSAPRIHYSRVIRWRGAKTTEFHRRHYHDGWDASYLVKGYDVLRDFSAAFSGTSIMMTENNMGVMKLKDFIGMVAENDTETLQTRMQLVDLAKSIAHSMVIDSDEEFERKPMALGGIADIIDRFMMRLCAAARVPVTVMFGRSPAGQNSTGESDMRNFYDEIRAAQKKTLMPKLNRLLRLIMLAKKGPTNGVIPDSWEIKFNPLQQQTPLEEAQEYRERSSADASYIDRDVLLPEEVAQSRFTDVGYSRQIRIDEELRRKAAIENAAMQEALARNMTNAQPNPEQETTPQSSSEAERDA